ncbi:MAG: histone deacetylase family protein [Desulfobacteraceae bacterium]|nr:histone deacetylase family protein [Desulfobacteraceae bacterium]MBU4055664.1 histone deacetylase family protein [Pseudomonadota bacterium]
MFRIRRIYDSILPINKKVISQVQAIIASRFPLMHPEEIDTLPDKLTNPMKHGFRAILFVAEGQSGNVKGLALLFHEPTLKFCFLDIISSAKQIVGRGIGGAIYDRTRREAANLNSIGIFFECLPDDPELCPFPDVLKENAARLKFYERFGARPITGTLYETPVSKNDSCPPYLVFDDLGKKLALSRSHARKIVRTILEQKYKDLCPPEYVTKVVNSIRDNPVQLRKFRYLKNEVKADPNNGTIPEDLKISLVINDKHEIHHVRDRGYVESPVRIKTILKEILPTSYFTIMPVRHFSKRYIKAVHDSQYVEYFKKVCSVIKPEESVYPYVFPIRNTARPPRELPIRAGYYCIDTFTPLNNNAYLAAKRAVDCALTAADHILEGRRMAYALVRPPGHHAERKSFGGFCYFSSTAIAANYLSAYGKIAILDVDYHHGNGQQDIFYKRSDVLTVSIHGHPNFAYPYFSGFKDEIGEEDGKGFNINFPLPEHVDGNQYHEILKKALDRIRRFEPNFLVIALGLDTAKGDPTGSWMLRSKDFHVNGQMIGNLGFPTLVVQEGGYNHRNLGRNARHFFNGLWEAQ